MVHKLRQQLILLACIIDHKLRLPCSLLSSLGFRLVMCVM